MIGQRQIDFRHEYRSRIMGWYDGYLHIVIIYAMGAAAFLDPGVGEWKDVSTNRCV